MTLFGIGIGLAAFLLIGLGFVWVIFGERYLGYLWWPYAMGLGAAFVALSLFAQADWLSALLGALGASFVWGATEFKEQAIRAELGWFPFRSEKIRPPFAHIIEKWKAPNL